jgi:thymidylate synthase
MYNARSQDVPLGTPFNIASYGLLLEIIAKAVNMVPDELIANMGDCHIYSNQIDGVKEQIGRDMTTEERMKWWSNNNKPSRDFWDYVDLLPENLKNVFFDENKVPKRTREPFELPTLKFGKTDEFFKSLGDDLSLLSHLEISDFIVENYQSHPTIKMPLSN